MKRITDSHGREHDVRWAGRTALIFQECAELLDTTTELIMAAHEDGRNVMAMYTPGMPEDTTVWAAAMRRNADGTLRLIRRERQPGAYEEIEARLKADLEEKLGEDEVPE